MSLEKEMGWKSLTLCHKSRAAAALLFLYLYSPAPQSLCAVMHAIASRGLHLIVKVSYSVHVHVLRMAKPCDEWRDVK